MATSEIDLNQLFNLNYNFDLLKNLIAGLLKSSKSNEAQIEELKERLDNKDKQISNLESKLVSNIRSLGEKIEEKTKEIEENVSRTLNEEESSRAKKSLAKFKQEEMIVELHKRIESLENESKLSKENIGNLEYYLNEIKKLNLKETQKELKENTDSINELKNENQMIQDRLMKVNKSIENMNVKLTEINIFDTLKASNKDGEGSQDISAYLLLVESLKKSVFQKFEFTDTKIEQVQDAINKLRIENSSNTKKLEVLSSDKVETNSKLDELRRNILDQKILINGLSMPAQAMKNISNMSDIGNEEISKKLKELSEKVEALLSIDTTPASNSNQPNVKGNNLNVESEIPATSLKSSHNLINIQNTSNQVTDDHSITLNYKHKFNEIEKNIKIMIIREKEKDEQVNKKFEALTSALKSKISADDFLKLSDMFSGLEIKTEMMIERFSHFDEKALTSDLGWVKKKIDGFSTSMQNIRESISKVGAVKLDDSDIKEAKLVDQSLLIELKSLVLKENEKIAKQIEELKKQIEEVIGMIRLKASEKDVKILEGKSIIFYLL